MARGGRRALALLLAALSSACGPEANPPPTDDAAAVLATFRFSCGFESFPVEALSGQIGAERADTAPAAALRKALAEPPVPGRPNLPQAGYRLLVSTPDAVEFGGPSNQAEATLTSVRVERSANGWAVVAWGGCTPQADVDGLNAASWQVAPDVPFPNRRTTEVVAMVSETVCMGGETADGRVLPPAVLTSLTEVLIIFAVRPLPALGAGGTVGCPMPRPTRVSVALPEPLGDRRLLDGGVSPPGNPFPEVVPVDVDPLH
jgi:hypothetical protein